MTDGARRGKTFWGVEFSVVATGLSGDEVVAFVNDLITDEATSEDPESRISSLTRTAERTMIEAEREAQRMLSYAKQRASSEGGERARLLLEQAKANAEGMGEAAGGHAAFQAASVIAKAQTKAREIVRKAQLEARELLESTVGRSGRADAEAEHEARMIVRRILERGLERPVATRDSQNGKESRA